MLVSNFSCQYYMYWMLCRYKLYVSHKCRLTIFPGSGTEVLLNHTCSISHWICIGFMMTSSNGNISTLLALCAGNSPVTGKFPLQRPVTRALMFSLICTWTSGWVDNRDAGGLKHHRTHYDVTVIFSRFPCVVFISGSNPIWINPNPSMDK